MNTTKALYETDFNLWLTETVNLLRKGDVEKLDLENLAEEVEDMGNNRKDALESNLIRVLQHLLKWKYQPQKRTNSWKASITEHSLRLTRAFKKSPSLKSYFEDVFAECYQDARLISAQETGLDILVFPEICLFERLDVLNPQYLPEDWNHLNVVCSGGFCRYILLLHRIANQTRPYTKKQTWKYFQVCEKGSVNEQGKRKVYWVLRWLLSRTFWTSGPG
ncbi:DUF29 domain-containing protein [Pseudanabaena sp. lw0831]|uniref:DUF29 domain-containing protein n=1 Tax=Pseudanabaena sp. lw0831 TaxID=1357935 RepID=UPI0019166A94|nr:DUF29 domain-containing protein [Pseudanabaena sp. lw0831]